jgi:glycosyltransferase involved in cell wall biosynthesis
MPRMLFAAAHRPGRSPSQRYRFEQFMPYWQQQGWSYEYAHLIDAHDDARFYAPGDIMSKGKIFVKSWLRRRHHVRIAHHFDIVFVQREAFMTGSTRFERGFKRSGAKLVFDFDDAIWHMDVSRGNRHLRWLKNPGKTADLIAMADLVIAGNDYLAEYAHHHNDKVVVIPTVIDTDAYRNQEQRQAQEQQTVTIGWTGSLTSVVHLEPALPLLRRLQREHGDRLRFRVISDKAFTDPELKVDGVIWNAQEEARQLDAIDIGIMPLPDDEWSRGKCGFKGLQYMGMGKAVVLSRVGVNTSIVQDGVNGFLASTEAEWMEKLSRLIADADLRRRLGAEARRTVQERYSVAVWRDRYLELFNELIKTNGSNDRPETHRAQ